jgi:hypothetical protein
MLIVALLFSLLVPGVAFADTTLVASIWPELRAGQVGVTTPFVAVVLNAGKETARNVEVSIAEGPRGIILTSVPDTVDIPPGGTQHFVIFLTPTKMSSVFLLG